MSYRIIVLPQAKERLIEIGRYISQVLMEPVTASGYVDEIEEAIKTLSELPKRIRLVDDEELRALGVRKLIVKSFLVYYTVYDENKTVYINDIIYSRSNVDPMIEK